MKKLLLIALVAIAFYGCKKDESAVSIVGSWKLVSITSKQPIDINEDGVKNTELLKEFVGCLEYNFDFRSDGSFYLESESSPETYQNGKWVTDVTKCESETLSGNWKVDQLNTNLSIWDNSEEVIKIEIILSGNTLVMTDGFQRTENGVTEYADLKFGRN